MTKTKFEITMNVEVADVVELPVTKEELSIRISRAVENIYFVNKIDIRNIHISRIGRVNITPKVIQKQCLRG